MSWLTLRRRVYRRDHGRCQVCLSRVGRVWDAGHLIDRIVGGDDTEANLVLMCQGCNRSLKPIHRTRTEALAWLREQQEQARTGREVAAERLAASDRFWRAMLAVEVG
jgi:5-methylcytosine-specific restriction endonuclease McrA